MGITVDNDEQPVVTPSWLHPAHLRLVLAESLKISPSHHHVHLFQEGINRIFHLIGLMTTRVHIALGVSTNNTQNRIIACLSSARQLVPGKSLAKNIRSNCNTVSQKIQHPSLELPAIVTVTSEDEQESPILKAILEIFVEAIYRDLTILYLQSQQQSQLTVDPLTGHYRIDPFVAHTVELSQHLHHNTQNALILVMVKENSLFADLANPIRAKIRKGVAEVIDVLAWEDGIIKGYLGHNLFAIFIPSTTSDYLNLLKESLYQTFLNGLAIEGKQFNTIEYYPVKVRAFATQSLAKHTRTRRQLLHLITFGQQYLT